MSASCSLKTACSVYSAEHDGALASPLSVSTVQTSPSPLKSPRICGLRPLVRESPSVSAVKHRWSTTNTDADNDDDDFSPQKCVLIRQKSCKAARRNLMQLADVPLDLVTVKTGSKTAINLLPEVDEQERESIESQPFKGAVPGKKFAPMRLPKSGKGNFVRINLRKKSFVNAAQRSNSQKAKLKKKFAFKRGHGRRF